MASSSARPVRENPWAAGLVLFAGLMMIVNSIFMILQGIAKGTPTAQMARELGCDRRWLLALRHRLQDFALRWLDRNPLGDAVVEADEMYQNAGEKRRAAHRPARPAATAGEQGPRPRHLGQRPGTGLRGGGPRQRPAPAVGRAARRYRDAEPGRAGGDRAAGARPDRRLAGI